MFDKRTFQQLTTTVEDNLIEGHLYNALSLLATLLDVVKSPGLKREVNSVQADYDRLLHYMAEGVDDPQRESLHRRFTVKVHRVLQNLRRTYHVTTGEDLFAMTSVAMKATWKEQYDQLVTKTDTPLTFDEQDQFFILIWISPQLNANEERQLRLHLLTADTKRQCYTISALTLALIQYFDAAKLRLLTEYSNTDDERVRAWAMTGIVVTCLIHHKSIIPYTTLRDTLCSKVLRTPYAIEALIRLQHQFSLYQDNEQLRKKIEEDLLPALLKASRERTRLGFGGDEEGSPDELRLSPDTRKKIDESARQMFRMFQEGVDINLHTFTALKGFPFFRHIGHWLAPFDRSRPEATNLPFIDRMRLCDSDTYSISLLARKMPAERLQELDQAIRNNDNEDENTDGKQGAKGREQDTPAIDPIQNTVQCLYRLLRRSPWTSLWPDIFAPIPFIDNPLLGIPLRESMPYLQHIAGIMLRNGHYELAEQHLHLYAQRAGSTAPLLFQLGLCNEQTRQYAKAVRYFQEALALEPHNAKTHYRLQHCYGRLARYEQQLDSLLFLEKHYPNDPHILTETGLCLIQLRRWEEAQRRFYKMEVSGQRLLPSMRAIAWCALRMGDYPLALRYYNRIIHETQAQSKWEDYLNAGHVHWLQGNTAQALDCYTEYAHRYLTVQDKKATQGTDAMTPFLSDAPVLLELGKSRTEISLMHDLIEAQLTPPFLKGNASLI